MATKRDDELALNQQVPQSFTKFDQDFKLLKKFGLKALKATMQLREKQQGNTALPDEQNVLDLVFTNPDVKNQLETVVTNRLAQLLRMHNVPRGDIDPNLANKDKLDNNPNLQARSQNRKMPGWAKNLEAGIDPKAFQNLITNINTNNPSTRGDAILTMRDALREQAKNELKLALRARPMPRPGSSPKLKPYGQ